MSVPYALYFKSGIRLTLLSLVSITMLSCSGGDAEFDEMVVVKPPEKVEKILNRPANSSCIAPDNAADTAVLLSNTGCYRDVANDVVIDAVIPYTVNSLLWTDGEKKGRYFAIPDGSHITLVEDRVSADSMYNGIRNGDFVFPVGSVIIKTFTRDTTRVETRLLMNHANDGWAGYAYEWNADQTEATLLTTAKIGSTGHFYPSPEQCMQCHTGDKAAKFALGPDTLQLNYTLYYTNGEEENFLESLERLNYLPEASADDYKQDRLYAIDDTSATLEQRVRSYLHSNCSGCHRVGTPEGGYGDLRYNSAFESGSYNVCGVEPTHKDSPGSALIEPGDAEASTILLRVATTDKIKMPPIGHSTVDVAAVRVIERWIDEMDNCD